MDSRGPRFFNSYDLFGKAIPGVVLLLGLILLIPVNNLEPSVPGDATLRNLAVILIAAVALGLIFGEAVHNLAINIERTFGWIRARGVSIREFISGRKPHPILFIKYVILDQSDSGNSPQGDKRDTVPGARDGEENESKEGIAARIAQWLNQTLTTVGQEETPKWIFPKSIIFLSYRWIRRRFSEIDSGFVSHRTLFYSQAKSQIEPYGVNERQNSIYTLFLDALETDHNNGRFKINHDPTDKESEELNESKVESNDFRLQLLSEPKEESKKRLQEIYPLITTRLEEAPPMRAAIFQARYSFCRSMWVSLGILTAAYAAIFVHSNEITTRNELENLPEFASSLVTDSVISRVLISLAIIIILFCFLEIILISIFEIIDRNYKYAGITGTMYIVFVYFAVQTQIPGKSIEVSFNILQPILLTAHGVLVGAVDLYFSIFNNSASVSDLLIYALFGDFIAPVIVLLGIATISFFDASGDYKEYYVEYLITEYTTIVKSTRDEEQGEEINPATGQRQGKFGS